MKYVVLSSGGISSALSAVEAVRKHGKESVILLNHDICPRAEHKDVKRFKQEVADYLGIEITYANMEGWEDLDQFDVCVNLGGWKFNNSPILCTYHMKTLPFYKWLKENVDEHKEDFTFLYGFDANEMHRINRRIAEMGKDGYITDYPMARWDRTIYRIEEIGIKPPEQYKIFKHANCIGCLKAKRQHWYVVYCFYPDIWKKAVWAENEIGYSLLPDIYLDELAELFKKMKQLGVQPTEKIQHQTFWADVKKNLSEFELQQCNLFDKEINMPCDCSF